MEKKDAIVGNFIVSNKRLGKGSSATVYLGKHRTEQYDVAVKKFELSPDDKHLRKRAEREIQILQSLHHNNIIHLYEIVRDKFHNDIYLFLEYCPHGSLHTFLGKGGYLEEHQARSLFHQLAGALKHLQERNIYHRDLKPHNLLLSSTFQLKIIDFGFSTLQHRNSFKRICGSPLYMAPEMIHTNEYHSLSDLWSIGIIMYEILFGHHPFPKMKHFSEFTKFMSQPLHITLPPNKRPAQVQPSIHCLNLLRRLLTNNPLFRISWNDFFSHPWITGVTPSPNLIFIANLKDANNNPRVKEITDMLQKQTFTHHSLSEHDLADLSSSELSSSLGDEKEQDTFSQKKWRSMDDIHPPKIKKKEMV